MSRALADALPHLVEGYQDEYGPIDHEIYAEAASLWPTLYHYARKMTADETQAWNLLVKTVARVSQRRTECGEIVNLRAYVITVFRRLAVDEMKLARRMNLCALDLHSGATVEQELDRMILARQLFRRMDPFTREVFELLILGYSFAEIAKIRSVDAAVLRTKFRRRMTRLSQQVKEEEDVPPVEPTQLPAK